VPFKRPKQTTIWKEKFLLEAVRFNVKYWVVEALSKEIHPHTTSPLQETGK
jgi:hypothetical protein